MPKNLPYNRAERVADAILQVVASVCYNELSDPRLKGVAITYVRMTKDLKLARVFYHMQDSDEKARDVAKTGLDSAAGFFKKAIGKEMKLRYMPKLEFFYDETIDLEEKIEQVISQRAAHNENI